LAHAGVRDVSVVVGFAAEQVNDHLKTQRPAGMHVATIFNPLFDRADNLTSCVEAFGEMHDDFLLINGDTLFEPAIITRLLESRQAPVSMAVVEKLTFDDDDMKVIREGDLVLQVSKGLPREHVTAEAIGLTFYRGSAPHLFREAIQEVARRADAHKQYYLAAVALLAQRRLVRGVTMNGLAWAEIDFPKDIPVADHTASLIASRLAVPARGESAVSVPSPQRWNDLARPSELAYEAAPLPSLR